MSTPDLTARLSAVAVTTFRGRPACPCLAEWLPVYEAELLRRGVIVRALDIYQLNGNATASAGTHTGGAADTAQTSDEAIWVARQMGADACWRRPHNWDGRSGILHTHLVLRDCPHNSGGRYQIAAVDAGFNGLGAGGKGGPDTGPRPLSGRTWREGIVWAQKQGKLPARVVRTREQLQRDVAETTAEIKRTKAARDAARRRGERVRLYVDAIAALKRIRLEQRKALDLLDQVPRR